MNWKWTKKTTTTTTTRKLPSRRSIIALHFNLIYSLTNFYIYCFCVQVSRLVTLRVHIASTCAFFCAISEKWEYIRPIFQSNFLFLSLAFCLSFTAVVVRVPFVLILFDFSWHKIFKYTWNVLNMHYALCSQIRFYTTICWLQI